MTATPENAPCWHIPLHPREICSTVRQFDKITDTIQVCYHTIACTYWAYILSTPGCFHRTVQISRPMAAILFLVTLLMLALLGQATRRRTSPQGRS